MTYTKVSIRIIKTKTLRVKSIKNEEILIAVIMSIMIIIIIIMAVLLIPNICYFGTNIQNR